MDAMFLRQIIDSYNRYKELTEIPEEVIKENVAFVFCSYTKRMIADVFPDLEVRQLPSSYVDNADTIIIIPRKELEFSLKVEPYNVPKPPMRPVSLFYNPSTQETVYECPVCKKLVGSRYLFNHNNTCTCGQQLDTN